MKRLSNSSSKIGPKILSLTRYLGNYKEQISKVIAFIFTLGM